MRAAGGWEIWERLMAMAEVFLWERRKGSNLGVMSSGAGDHHGCREMNPSG